MKWEAAGFDVDRFRKLTRSFLNLRAAFLEVTWHRELTEAGGFHAAGRLLDRLSGGYVVDVTFRTDVIDEDTGKKIGFAEAARSPRARHISLFGGKYQSDFESHEECNAFAKGVEAVLNHLVDTDEEQIESDEAA